MSSLLDQHAAVRTITCRERLSNRWFDEECRAAKLQVRRLEKIYRVTNEHVDRDAWKVSSQRLYKLYNRKKAAATVEKINENKNDSKKLWQTLNATLGLSEVTIDSPHSR